MDFMGAMMCTSQLTSTANTNSTFLNENWRFEGVVRDNPAPVYKDRHI
jgi:hypothetical protein